MDLRTSIHTVFGERPSRLPPDFVPAATGPDDEDDMELAPATVLDAGR